MRNLLIAATVLALAPVAAMAHGDVGDRSFPATIAIDDPGVGDEVNFPQVSYFKERGDDGYNGVTEVEGEYAKTLTENWGVAVGMAGIHEDSDSWGASNVELSTKYVFLRNDAHEFMMSAGLAAEIGGTGAERVGADDYSTVTPQLFFGKGFGDVKPAWLKPVAVTGQLGYSLPTDRHTDGERNSDTLNYGLALQYSLPYAAETGTFTGLSKFARQLTPIVELNMETPFRGDDKETTGTVQPGVLWQSDNGVQVGLEAILPVNTNTGHGIGAVAQVHFYLDDLLPNSPLAKPIW